MMICGEIDNRLDRVVTFDDLPDSGTYLLVVHPNDPDSWVDSELSDRLSDPNCGGILLVKGVPRSGLSRDQFAELKKKYDVRFHACAWAIGTADEHTRLSGDLETLFRNFFETVRSADRIDWEVLEPRCPVMLLAGYLLAKVLGTDFEEAELVHNRRTEWATIWEGARREYELLTDQNLPHLDLNRVTAHDVTKSIWEYLCISNTIVTGSSQRESVRVASA
jgi:hypothetical protein